MADGGNQGVWPNHDVVANMHRKNIENDGVVINQDVIANMDIAPVVAAETRGDDDAFAHAAQQRAHGGLPRGSVAQLGGGEACAALDGALLACAHLRVADVVGQASVEFFKLSHVMAFWQVVFNWVSSPALRAPFARAAF